MVAWFHFCLLDVYDRESRIEVGQGIPGLLPLGWRLGLVYEPFAKIKTDMGFLIRTYSNLNFIPPASLNWTDPIRNWAFLGHILVFWELGTGFPPGQYRAAAEACASPVIPTVSHRWDPREIGGLGGDLEMARRWIYPGQRMGEVLFFWEPKFSSQLPFFWGNPIVFFLGTQFWDTPTILFLGITWITDRDLRSRIHDFVHFLQSSHCLTDQQKLIHPRFSVGHKANTTFSTQVGATVPSFGHVMSHSSFNLGQPPGVRQGQLYQAWVWMKIFHSQKLTDFFFAFLLNSPNLG